MLALRDALSPDELLDRFRARYPGLVQTTTWGERVLFYNPRGTLPHGVYFVSLKERDSANDRSSELDERGAYRVNFGLTPLRYHTLFGVTPTREEPGSDRGSAGPPSDTMMPHPVYAWMSWAAIVNPSAATLVQLWPVFDESYALAQTKHAARLERLRAGDGAGDGDVDDGTMR
jgi:hypothetical protein